MNYYKKVQKGDIKMFDKIVYMNDSYIFVNLSENADIRVNMLNLHVAIIDSEKALLGEIEELNNRQLKIRLLGEFVNGKLNSGVIRKPLLDARIRSLRTEELPLILGFNQKDTLLLGESPYYSNSKVYSDINKLLGHHFAIFGNSGSGKSCGLARILQNIFENKNAYPYKANFILFDISGEYTTAFRNLNAINPNYNYRIFTTNKFSGYGEQLRIPLWLLNSNDIALLLMCNSHSQLPIIEQMLKLTKIFAENDEDSIKIKNHLIAKAMLSVIYSNQSAANKRNDIFSIVETCGTNEFDLETEVQGVGYTRKFRDCFLINKSGEFSESILVTDYISGFINDEYDNYEPKDNVTYTLLDMEKALNFALISESWFKNENSYNDASTIKVRLHSLITGKYFDIFNYKEFVTTEEFLTNMLIDNNKRYQLVNINLDDVDDSMASVITKIFTRIIFDFSKSLPERASLPFHILIDEAHRYIKNDSDNYLLGFNIFERVAKEGRKYGVLLGIISQRPVELSDTVISQISNFIIFKTNHPRDLEYLKQMIPNISSDIIDKQKALQAGTALAFGAAFNIPLMIRFDKPNPMINAENCNVTKSWGNE